MTTFPLHRVPGCLAALAFVLVSGGTAFAQDPTGTIEGAITDRTGSAVPAATVTAEHRDTGFRRETAASPDGLYRLQLLPIGAYRVTVAAQGFGSIVREPIVVTVGQTVRLDLPLEVSSVVETVTVTGGAPLVETSSNALASIRSLCAAPTSLAIRRATTLRRTRSLVSATRIVSATLTNSLRATWLRHTFFFDQRLNRTPPSELGFGYESSNEIGQGPPFFNVSGYTPIGGAITGPRTRRRAPSRYRTASPGPPAGIS